MKKIELTQGQVALVDDWKYDELNQDKWQAAWDERTQSFYATRKEGKKPFQRTIQMHRQIMNTPKGMVCDHRNHDTLDNQEHNLRNATHSQNGMNSRLSSKKYFDFLDEAISARDEAIKKFHGAFAWLPK